MQHLVVDKIEKSYGDKLLFQDVSFTVGYGEKISIVGANGSGKSTLLNIIVGREEPDSGSVKTEIWAEKLNQNIDTDFEDEDLYCIEPKYYKILNIDADIVYSLDKSNLSGGELTKLALCILLSKNPEMLILDEPTNNLDFEGIKVLIKLLKMYNGTLIIVSHDRYFLDNCINRIIEIDNQRVTDFRGNYTAYRDFKDKQYEDSLKRYEDNRKKQKEVEKSIKQLQQWSDKAHRESTKKDSSGLKTGIKEYKRAKAKKMDNQVKSGIKRIEKMREEGEQRPIHERNIYFDIKGRDLMGKPLFLADDIMKSYGEKVIIKKSRFSFSRGEKIAVFGANGCGKTTLVKIIEGTEKVDSGEIWISPSASAYILHQDFTDLPPNITAAEFLNKYLGYLTPSHKNILFGLGLTQRQLSQKIGTLSYGEQMKLKLALPILLENEFLILDEPTNHIDMPSREMLEKTLTAYQGTVLIVSHDIRLLQNVCNKVLLFEDQTIKKLEVSFAEYLVY